MKKYKAKMRFKAVTNAIIMTNRMKGAFKVKSAGNMVPSLSSVSGASTDPHTDSYHDDQSSSIDDGRILDPALESFPLSLQTSDSNVTGAGASVTQATSASSPGTGPVTGTSVRFTAGTVPSPVKTTVSAVTTKIADSRTPEEKEKDERERLEKEKEEQEEAKHRAAVERKKSKGLIIISAPSDENSIYEEDDSYLVACID
jgi:hypothetical protein